MEIKDIGKNITGFLKKYKYVCLDLLVGLLLMLLPDLSSPQSSSEKQTEIPSQTKTSEEEKLAAISLKAS